MTTSSDRPRAARRRRGRAAETDPFAARLGDDPQWYKDAIIYELHVRAFRDSDGDGIGDFRGLAEKLDYLEDLGITALWLLPFYPSPLRDDGYDISDPLEVHPDYGTLQDFRLVLREAHARGIRVITELVLNHTSSLHPWFERARRAPPGSSERDFYVWSDTDERYPGVRIIFQDFETSNWTFDRQAQAFYWHRFYHHQPDLNYDNPAVRRAMKKVIDYWLGMGVDGMRLDAVPYLFEREGTNCENLPETHAFLRELRAHVDRKFAGRMLLAEANMWPEDAAAYFGQGDECHMNFHFPLMPRLFMALRMEDRFPIIDILDQTPAIPDSCQWALFLRNHDELTLEMVTDRERDYMYRVYATDPRARINLGIRRRLAPLLQNDRRKIELLKGLLFSLPGTPVLYYGDELGMGDNIYLGDRNGVRTPMQWSADRNAGFSRANPQSLYLPVNIDPEHHYEAVNVETQQKNPSSLLWWTKGLIALRKRHRAFGRGSLEFLRPDNPKVLAFVRAYEDERILVVANLSRFVQAAALDLAGHAGVRPRELFGGARLPRVEEGRLYQLTLAPYSFLWLSLTRAPGDGAIELRREPHVLPDPGALAPLLALDARGGLERLLPTYLRRCRWFRSKAFTIRAVVIREVIPLPAPTRDAALVLLDVDYLEHEPETYLLPLARSEGERARELAEREPWAVIAALRGANDGAQGLLHDGLASPEVLNALLGAIERRRPLRGARGEVTGSRTAVFALLSERRGEGPPSLLGQEQSNTSAAFGQAYVLKVYRAVQPGPNPDLELGRFLTARGFAYTAQVAGELTYHTHARRGARVETTALAALFEYVANEGDAWRTTLDALGRTIERVLSQDPEERPRERRDPLTLARDPDAEPPASLREAVGVYFELARLLGDRTARLHLALASEPADPAFAPERYPPHAQRSLHQGLRTSVGRALRLLRSRLDTLAPEARRAADELIAREAELYRGLRAILGAPLESLRIRVHGDFHLGQALYTGKDFHIIDFEGEPTRPLSERRLKDSPLRDVAGMLRSFHYAAHAALHGPGVRQEDREPLRGWLDAWYRWVGAVYLRAYLETGAGAPFLPVDPGELRVLLDAHLLEKAAYELEYELNNRPDWVSLPLQGFLARLSARPAEEEGA